MSRELLVLLVFLVYFNHRALSYHVAPFADFTVEIEHTKDLWSEPDVRLREFGKADIFQHAAYCTWYPKYTYHGAQATVDVHSYPNLNNGEVVAAQIWLSDYRRGDDIYRRNSIQAGWTVSPSDFGDSRTRFFVYWTIARNSTGCYNLDCDGFVPVNFAPITPGDILDPANGQNKISFKMFKNKDDGDWWLYSGYDINDLKPVGFWLKSIFTGLVDNAPYVAWGGYVGANRGSPSPPMGNGQWPGKKSTCFRDIMLVDISGQPYAPDIYPRPGSLRDVVSNVKCYQVSANVNKAFNYGGPGGCTN